MKKFILLSSSLFIISFVFGQAKETTSAIVSFDATTIKDTLPKAKNKTVVALIDTKTGEIAFEAPVKNFSFSNPVIQEHFNEERWMNSSKFSSFTFEGKITDVQKYNFSKNGIYSVSVTGQLTVKGISTTLTTPATIEVKDGNLITSASFSITLADYGIQVGDGTKIAAVPKIKVYAEFK